MSSVLAIKPLSNTPASTRRVRHVDKSTFLVLPACIVIAAALLIPLANVLLLSLNRSQPGVIELSSNFTLANYTRFLWSPFYMRVLGKTVYIAAMTTTLCTVFGAILAMAIWRAPQHLRGVIVIVVISPLLVSIVTRTFGWMIVLGDNGLINSTLMSLGVINEPLRLMFTDGAVIVGLLHVFLPLMVLPILTALDRIDPNVPQAANTLGASRFTTATEVVLPLAAPGLVSGITIVFSLSMSSYITPALMGGPDSGMITTLIYQQFVVTFNWQFGATLVAILLAVSLVLVAVILFEFARRTRKWMVRQ
ncbi:ABC transporter permease [Chelatococcus asaccharovorans]|uniref:Putative spermidine/putrescine transport system permease protein n=1 Tax=Chelatococcus asaccharovorans TaxID=28210 RepID=A0A2V3UF45_9HYPH|nr:ABC transporter permease [Chelatococcus asaccharovorans]MBS7707414.1 ABC transporter permease [Chelatococcus asaccharovorans]PXW63594.1 putative spermidine/putrescine transport system permease protein [Chelatococcus asaccharovorans]CAH1650288.1 putative spermidine/putrescine transport system permease protein [Chelatococcus asaccharovorans]CAH1692170.1 putative spermidine/putrescine transport system permease protein [Chelatococcus asaccharovorans]